MEVSAPELVLRRPRRRRAAALVGAGLVGAVASALAAASTSPWALVLLAPAAALLVAGARDARGGVALVVDGDGLRDGAGRRLCRWADVAGAELEVQRDEPDDVYTERVELSDGSSLALVVSGLSQPPLEVHKAVRARLPGSRGERRPAAAARERARAHLRAGRIEDALAAFNEALRLDPHDGASYHGRSEAFRARGELERAEADLNEAIRCHPRLAAAHLERAALRLRRGRPKLALEDVSRALELRPGDPVALALRAQAAAALEPGGQA